MKLINIVEPKYVHHVETIAGTARDYEEMIYINIDTIKTVYYGLHNGYAYYDKATFIERDDGEIIAVTYKIPETILEENHESYKREKHLEYIRFLNNGGNDENSES